MKLNISSTRTDYRSVETNPPTEAFPRILLICGRKEKDLRDKLAQVLVLRSTIFTSISLTILPIKINCVFLCSQIEKLPHNRHFISLINDSLGQHMPLHIWRGFTLLPSLKPISDVGVSIKL